MRILREALPDKIISRQFYKVSLGILESLILKEHFEKGKKHEN